MIAWPTKTSAVIVQGMTGKEGSRMTRWMLANGTRVCAGVTPGKGGTLHENIPVFENVAEARAAFPDACVSSIVVPPMRVLSAVHDALSAGIAFIHILTEQVPVHDALALCEAAKQHGATVLGPASVGIVSMPGFQLGYLGGQEVFQNMQEGSLALLSTSGGMANEIMMACARNGIGLRLAAALGGSALSGLTMLEAVQDCERRDDIERLVLFLEPGQPILNALLTKQLTFQKPTTVFLAGKALDVLPKGVSYGHTGTLLGDGQRTVAETYAGLQALDITCVETIDELVSSLKTL